MIMGKNTVNRRVNLYINGKEAGNDVKSVRAEMQKLVNEQARMKLGSDEYVAHAKRIRELKSVINEHNRQLQVTERRWFSLSNLSDGFNKYFGMIGSFLAGLTGVVLGFRKCADEANKFEENLDNLSALTGLEGKNLEWLGEQAEQMSVKTTESGIRIKQSATDILDAFTKMGSQRPELLKNKEALAAVTEDAIILSEASKMKLEPAAASLANVMNQFNEQSSASRRIINELAAGAQAGSGDIRYLSDAIEKCGTTSYLLGLQTNQTIGIIEAVAPKYKEASMAGNSLDKVLLKMKEKQIGYKNGVFDLNAALDELQGRFKRGERAADIFGVEHAKMAEVLILAREDINRYTEAVTGTDKAIEQAVKNTNNAVSARAQAMNKLKLQMIEVGEKISPAITMSTNAFTYFLKALVRAPQFFKENRTLLISLAGALASYTALSAGAVIQTKLLTAKTSLLNGVKRLYNTISGETLLQKAREEAASSMQVTELEKLLTSEQKAVLQKKALSRESREYASTVTDMVNKTAAASKAELQTLIAETNAHKNAKNAKLSNKAAADALVIARQEELVTARLSGDATKISAAEKRLEVAVNKQSIATSELLTARRTYETSKTKLATAATKNNTLAGGLATAQNAALSAATNVTSTATARLTLMMKALWASMKTNPVGWILTLISLATTVFAAFSSKTKEVTKELGELATAVQYEGQQVNSLILRLTDSNTKENDRKKILEELRELQPELVKGIDAENIATQKLTERVQEYNDELVKRMALASKQDAVNEAIKEENEAKMNLANAEAESRKALVNFQAKFPDLKIKKKSSEESIWDWREISENEKKKFEQELSKIFADSNSWDQKLLQVKELFPGNIQASYMDDTMVYKDIDLSEITDALGKIYEARRAVMDAQQKIVEEQKDVENYKATYQQIFNGGKTEPDNSALIDQIKLLTDKQKLQEYTLNQDAEIQVAAKKRLEELGKEANETLDLIKAKEQELEMAQKMPGRTKAEITLRNKKVHAIEEEIKKLKSLGVEDKKEISQQKKLANDRAKVQADLTAKLQEIDAKLNQNGMTSSMKEIMQAHQKYDELLDLCVQYGLEDTEVEEAREKEIAAITEKYSKKSLTDFISARAQIEEVLMTSSEREKAEIREKYETLIELAKKHGIDTVALQEKMDKELGEVKNSAGADMFGMTQEDWDTLSDKINMALDMAGQLTDIWGKFNQIQANREQKELQDFEKSCNKKKELLNKQLDSGKISQEKYNAQVAQLDADMDKKKAEIAKKQAKRDRATAVTNTIINTASAIMRIWSDVPKGDFGVSTAILTGLAAAAGAAQLGVILSQPLPEFAQGGKTDGARLYVAGEAGQEWISPNWMLEDPVTGPIIERLELVRSGIMSPKELAPVIPDWQTMTSVPLYAGGGYTGNHIQTNYYNTTENHLPVYSSVFQEMNQSIRDLCEYLSDERNRRAVISNDLLLRNEAEMRVVNRLKRL